MNPRGPDDFKRARRERRLGRTLDLEPEVARWAAQHGFTLRVLNDGHHWLLQKPGLTAEWWPSSAKRVLNRDYLRDHHAPHWPQVAAAIEQAMTAPRSPCPPGSSAPSRGEVHPMKPEPDQAQDARSRDISN
jgi:hypothetical protein